MAGTVTTTEQLWSSIKRIKFSWTSNASGAADAVTTNTFVGDLLRIVQIPGTSGVQPTDLYDITVVDDDGLDALFGQGANISNAAASQKKDSDGLGCISGSKLTLHVTNAGNAKSGVTIVYLR